MPLFKPGTTNNKNVISILKFPISFRSNPDSLYIYNKDNFIGTWIIQAENQLNCIECPKIIFHKDQTATLLSDTIYWTINNRLLTLRPKSRKQI